MVGFRAAGWTCFATSVISLIVTVIWLRDIGNAKSDAAVAATAAVIEAGADSDTATQVGVVVDAKEKEAVTGNSEKDALAADAGLKVITPAPSTLFTATSRTQSVHGSSTANSIHGELV